LERSRKNEGEGEFLQEGCQGEYPKVSEEIGPRLFQVGIVGRIERTKIKATKKEWI